VSTQVFVADTSSEHEYIDSFRPRTIATSPHVEQSDNPGENPMQYSESRPDPLPDPTVGWKIGSGDRNGWSNGFVGTWLRRARFTGRVWTGGENIQANPIQGRGTPNVHAANLYAGVRQQLAAYDGSLTTQALSFVGPIPGAAAT
jgi:hypothetical protein